MVLYGLSGRDVEIDKEDCHFYSRVWTVCSCFVELYHVFIEQKLAL